MARLSQNSIQLATGPKYNENCANECHLDITWSPDECPLDVTGSLEGIYESIQTTM